MRIGIGLLVILCAGSLVAQQRTFVSTQGLDTNPCTRQAPCRNFGAAVTAVQTGGEVVALDSGGYGQVTLTKSVSVIAPTGVHAAITALSGDAMTLNASGGVFTISGIRLTGL